MPSSSTTVVMPYRAAGVVLGAAAGPSTIVSATSSITDEALIRSVSNGIYQPGGSAGNIGTTQGDLRYAALAQAVPTGGADGQVLTSVSGAPTWASATVVGSIPAGAWTDPTTTSPGGAW